MKVKMLKPTAYEGTPRKIGEVFEVEDEGTARRWIDRKIAEEVPGQRAVPDEIIRDGPARTMELNDKSEVAPTDVSETFDSQPPKATTKKEKKSW
jgi:hypothetical protein